MDTTLPWLGHPSPGSDPSYRLNLTVEPETATALQAILDHGPFDEMFTPYSPLKGQNATFSIKYEILQKSGDVPNLKDSDPFPFLFDGRTMAKGPKLALQDYSPSLLAASNLLAVETNISTFNMTGRGDAAAIPFLSVNFTTLVMTFLLLWEVANDKART
ncbi:hypothetical protein V8E54_002072 [Elaphomyces granulatus]